MLWELEFGSVAQIFLSPEASAPDPFFGGGQNPRAKQVEEVVLIPQIIEGYQFYWEAWKDLKSERLPDGSIPWSAIKGYASHYKADLSILKEVVWLVDNAYVKKSVELAKRNIKTEGNTGNG